MAASQAGGICADAAGRTRGMDTYGFHPSCESPRFPLGYLGGDYIGEIQKGTVSVHVFRRDGHWPSHFAAGSRQIALVLRSDGLTSARAACLRRPNCSAGCLDCIPENRAGVGADIAADNKKSVTVSRDGKIFTFSMLILPQIEQKIKSCTVLRLGVINIEDNLRQYRIIEQE